MKKLVSLISVAVPN